MSKNKTGEQFFEPLFGQRMQAAAARGRKATVEAIRHCDMRTYQKENCKYTHLSALGKDAFAQADIPSGDYRGEVERLLERFPDVMAQTPRLVFINGQFCEELSDYKDAPITVRREEPARDQDISQDEDPFYLLNRALGDENISVEVRATDKATDLVILSFGEGGEKPISFHPYCQVALQKNASLNLLVWQQGKGAYFYNPVLEVTLDDGASMEHLTIQQESQQAVTIAPYRIRTGESASYRGFVMGLGGHVSRFEMRGLLEKKHAELQLNGMQFLQSNSVGDLTGYVEHKAPQCVSRQFVKNVAENEARCVFQGKVMVHREASQTDGIQLNQNLLLSPKAQIDTKPELEIYAEDVRCNHGATIGDLDSEAMFYLQTRGIPYKQAKEILIEAFLNDALSHVAHEKMRLLCQKVLSSYKFFPGE